MKLYINEKVFSLHDKFFIYDENGNNVYEVSSKFPSYWKKTMICDMDGNKLLDIKQVPLKKPAAYDIYEDGEFALKISGIAGWFSRNYELSNGYRVKSKSFPLKAKIYNEKDEIIGTIIKKNFSLGDKYEIEVFEERHELLAIAITVAIAISMNRGQSGYDY